MRTAYPYIVGANEIPKVASLVVNLISSIMWICPRSGWVLPEPHQNWPRSMSPQFLSIILYLPVVLLVAALIALVWRWLEQTQGQRLQRVRPREVAVRRPFMENSDEFRQAALVKGAK